MLSYMLGRSDEPQSQKIMIPAYDAPNPARDTVQLINEQISYLLNHPKTDGPEGWRVGWQMYSQQLCAKSARGLMIVFGGIDFYSGALSFYLRFEKPSL